MESVNDTGAEVWLSPATNPERKLKYTWEMIRIGKTLVGINTALPNKLVADAVEAGRIGELTGYATLRREVKYGRNSRIDILLEDPAKPPCYVEVKNTTMRRDLRAGPVEFPDAVTERGSKHLAELSDMVRAGARAVMFYLVQREDAPAFSTADDIDPTYGAGLREAMRVGVEVLCYDCRLTAKEIEIAKPVPLKL